MVLFDLDPPVSDSVADRHIAGGEKLLFLNNSPLCCERRHIADKSTLKIGCWGLNPWRWEGPLDAKVELP